MLKDFHWKDKLWLLLATLAIITTITIPITWNLKSKEIEITIKEKERWVGDHDTKYLIHTDSTTYQNKNSLWYFKFNSADYQRYFKVGSTYKVKVVGWRAELGTVFPNIVEVISEIK